MTANLSDNLLSVLHRWAARQDENFITDSFAHLLRRLLQYDEVEGTAIIKWLTAEQFAVPTQQASSITVTTQVSTVLGRPDIEIRALNFLAFLEAKVESELGDKQLHRYLAELDKSESSVKVLVLLSRYPMDVSDDIVGRVIRKRWFEVADYLLAKLKSKAIGDGINVFLTKQFIDFLKGRNITMERISWELPNGVKSLRSLLAMLDEALASANCTFVKTSGWEWVGYYLVGPSESGPKGKPYYVGIYYEQPGIMVFETNEVAVIPNAVEVAGVGKLVIDRYKPGGNKWVNELVLDSEHVHFFALSRESQMQSVGRFLIASLDAVKRIKKNNLHG